MRTRHQLLANLVLPDHHHHLLMSTVILLLVCRSSVEGATTTTGTMWCISRSGVTDSALQSSLDYACGSGADCAPISSNGLCYLPNTLQAHASYAMNSYYQRMGRATGSCDFSATAVIATTDPSYGSCVYPSTASSAGGTTTVTAPSTTLAPPTVTTPPPPGVLSPPSSSIFSPTVPTTGTGSTLTPPTPTFTATTNTPTTSGISNNIQRYHVRTLPVIFLYLVTMLLAYT